MATYAVHSPALDGDTVAAFGRARTLRLGFARWAFVFGPFWLLGHGLWRALAGWLVGAAIVFALLAAGLIGPGSGWALYVLSALYLGLEGRALQAAALTRVGAPLADIVAGAKPEDAERAFLARALTLNVGASAPRGSAAPSRASPSIIGLFPEARG